MDWIQKKFRTIIYISFLIPILTVAFVSISHVTTWYGISNPMTWAIYLSIGIEIAALSALAAISARMGRMVYFPFGIVTLIQFIGNIYFSYQYIDVDSTYFKDWMDLVDPVVSYLGVESGNIVAHKRFLALFSGGMLPLISLSFLHMLVKFEEEEKNKSINQNDKVSNDSTEDSVNTSYESPESYKKPTQEDVEKLGIILDEIQRKKFGAPLDENNNIEETKVENLENTVVQDEPNNETEIIESEPDFYLEEEPKYSMDIPSEDTGDGKKRLTYSKVR